MNTNKNAMFKKIDAWFEVFIIDPISAPIATFFSKFNVIHPLHFTVLSLTSKIFASILIFMDIYVVASFIFFLGILFDGIDGKIARTKNLDIYLHGTLDFITDHIGNLVFWFSLYKATHQHFIKELLILFILLQFFHGSLASTKFRLFNMLNDIDVDNPENIEKKYVESLSIVNSKIIRMIAEIYLKLLSYSTKYRTYPHPTEVDAEYTLYIFLPISFIIGSSISYIILGFAIITIIIGIIYLFTIDIILTLKVNKERDLYEKNS